jgi:hypothetical protein
MEGIDPVSDMLRKEINGLVEESELHLLVHARRKRVRFIRRIGRFIKLSQHITDEIREECRQAEKAFTRAKPFYVRIAETFRKMFK